MNRFKKFLLWLNLIVWSFVGITHTRMLYMAIIQREKFTFLLFCYIIIAITSFLYVIFVGKRLFKRRIYYKVVRVTGWTYGKLINECLTSVFTNHNYSLRYKIDISTKPLIGKIFIFDTEINAKNFMQRFHKDKLLLFKCKARRVKKKQQIASSINTSNIQAFWKDNWWEYSPSLTPAGSLIASEITLVEQVF